MRRQAGRYLRDGMPDELRVLTFDPTALLDAEAEVIACTARGGIAVFAGAPMPVLRAAFLRHLLLGLPAPREPWPVRLPGVHIRGACIDALLDLADCAGPGGAGLPALALEQCDIPAPIDLGNARLSRLSLRDSRIGEVRARRLPIDGSLDISGVAPLADAAWIDAHAAAIEGDLLARGALLKIPPPRAGIGHRDARYALRLSGAPAISKVAYDPVKDFTPISLFSIAPQVLVVNPKFPAKTLAEFIAHVKTQQGKLSYAGGGGPGSSSNLIMATFLKRAGLDMSNVSYRGTAPAMTDLIAGHIPTMFVPISEALPGARRPIRMLAVSSGDRASEAPEVPTVAEQGFPGFHMVSWTGMMGPANLPKDIVDKIAVEFGRAFKDPVFVEHVRKAGSDPAVDTSPAGFAAFVAQEIVLWGDAVKTAGVTLK